MDNEVWLFLFSKMWFDLGHTQMSKRFENEKREVNPLPPSERCGNTLSLWINLKMNLRIIHF